MRPEQLTPEKYDHYYFRADDDRDKIYEGYQRKLDQLLETPVFTGFNSRQKADLLTFWLDHFENVRGLFAPEEQKRLAGHPEANLYYHGIPHADQAGFDTISILLQLIHQDKRSTSYLTPTGVSAAVISGPYHDSGYVTREKIWQNCVTRTPIHVEESIRTSLESLGDFPLPLFLDKNRKRLVEIIEQAIFATNFPFTKNQHEQQLNSLKEMEQQEQIESTILADILQWADLGGQAARIDYFPTLVLTLREELEAKELGTGIKVIGADDELAEKTAEFFKNFVLPGNTPFGLPTVGSVARRYLKTDNHAFYKEWINQGVIRTELPDVHFCTLPLTQPFVL